ncbi:MAG: hypothetical protein M1281_19010 [Chloroflexi bacterium]|nr:hypothetical protein [Chloroflexota bacterium]
MSRITTQPSKLLILGIVLILLTSACAPDQSLAATPPPDGTYPVDTIFREFYNTLGGERNLGYAISQVVEDGALTMQYTENAVMRYNPSASPSEKLSLAPVGEELHQKDQPMLLPEQSGARIIDGYIVYEDFVHLYDALQSSRFAGRPLTQVRINYDRGRIEQYFENVGLYELLDDPQHIVHLLSYGVWKCDAYCNYKGDANAAVSPQTAFPEPLIGSLARLGVDFTGRPLSEPYVASDGMIEQIYTNFVLYADPTNVELVNLRPIPPMVGFPETPPVAKQNDDRVVFYRMGDDLGHNVPKIFDEYISAHGGIEYSGTPATEIFQYEAVYRQCFKNYCLDYDPNAAEALRVRLAPLGELYLQKYPPAQSVSTAPSSAPVSYRMSVKEAVGLIPSSQAQKISVDIVDDVTQAPAPNLEPELSLVLPDGSQPVYHFPATDASGHTALTLAPISAENGTLVPYTVCLNQPDGHPACVQDSFVIWGNP